MKKYIYILFLLLFGSSVYAQNKKEIATAKFNSAIELMDNGMIKESIALLKEAKRLDKGNYAYDYEIAFAHYLDKDYKSALEWFKKTLKYENTNDQCYQMLGNLYDMNGMPEKALKTYDKGLKKFPKAGNLYVEKGNVFLNQQKYNDALRFYEEGIFADPFYPVNYYRATRLYLNSDDEIWGMIYGEIFMNMQRGSDRTIEISKMLFDTYASEIKFTSDTSVSVSFAKNHTIYFDPKQMKKNPESLLDMLKLPYANVVYEATLVLSAVNQDTINLASINEIRTNFITNYYENKHHEKYPVALFEYSKQMIDLGFYEAYNYWILMKGNEEEFDIWHNGHQKEWDDFVSWFEENPFVFTEKDKFYSGKY